MSAMTLVVLGGALLLAWSLWRMLSKPGPRA